MFNKQSLKGRIVTAFVVMTLVVGGMFSWAIVAIVHLVEESLVTKQLDEDFRQYFNRDLLDEADPVLSEGQILYRSKSQYHPIPQQFDNLGNGYHEVEDASNSWFVLVREIDDQKFVLVENQDQLEARERLLYNIVLAGYLFSVFLSWGLGWLVARQVMAPVIRLSAMVDANALETAAKQLAPEFADDEVGQLANAFDGAITKLNLALQRERLFTSDVSHELRTPLMIIGTSAELLQTSENLNVNQKKQLQRIISAAYEMKSLVETFLLLARAKYHQNHNHSDNQERLSLMQVAQEQIAYLSPEAEKKAIDLSVQHGLNSQTQKTPAQNAEAKLYSAPYLRIVMSNLLRNAINYTTHGSVIVIIEEGAFRVEDTGSGIPVNEQATIFQPFVRGVNTAGEGMGLGLSLVERICEYQGWKVSVANLAPQGSSFRVVLSEE